MQRTGSNPPLLPSAATQQQSTLPQFGGDWQAPSAASAGGGVSAVADMAELERRLLEAKLREQQRQMQEDKQWLANEESSIVSG